MLISVLPDATSQQSFTTPDMARNNPKYYYYYYYYYY
jgi:hypothetical protein